MVHFMAFSCKTGSIDRCLELEVSASTLGQPCWAPCSVVTPAQDHLSKNVFGFHLPLYNLFPLSIMVARVNVPSTIDSYEPLEMEEMRGRRIGQEWKS